MSVKCPCVNFSDPLLGFVASTMSCVFPLLHICLFSFWEHFRWWGAVGVTKSTLLLSANSGFHLFSAPTWKLGLGKTSNTKIFKNSRNKNFSLHLGKSQGCRHEDTSLSSMMPFPGHWGKGVGGVRRDGVTGPPPSGIFGYTFLPSWLGLCKSKSCLLS